MEKNANGKYTLENGTEVDDFFSVIQTPDGRKYGLKCAVIEAYPINCPNCGSTFELAFGKGRCEHCGTYFTTEFKLQEVK